MLKNNKLCKFNKIVVSIFLILATCFSIVFVATQVNKSSNNENLSLSAVSDVSGSSINTLSFIEPYDIIDNIGCEECNSYVGVGTSEEKAYHEAPWYGRMKCLTSTFSDKYTGRMYTLELNVDVRDIKLFNDDVIVEFKFYYQDPNLGLKKTMKVDSLYIYADFYSNGTITASPTRNCSDKSSAGFTIQGGQKTDEVRVKVSYNYHDGYDSVNNKVYFLFDNNDYCTHK